MKDPHHIEMQKYSQTIVADMIAPSDLIMNLINSMNIWVD